ncbi:DUF6087 family protein [Streptomyces sp. NPDC058476]|uniref:DUF6087 family protein n=1 Tax=Streptomyces sp. NPDC058476 TaxID=3346519 RepID=UPI0036603337
MTTATRSLRTTGGAGHPWTSTAGTARCMAAGGHLCPDEPRALEEWDGFAYVPAGTADNLAAAHAWASGTNPRAE